MKWAWDTSCILMLSHTEKTIENNFVEEIKENQLQGRSIYTWNINTLQTLWALEMSESHMEHFWKNGNTVQCIL